MPIYEYVCEECNREFDILVLKRDQADSQVCPQCGSERLKRKVSAFARPGSGCSCSSRICSSKST
ncbi:MAG: zinc ribbon domain-containing protein [candidate division Zixibacteria bacterium]|nr:zinc ribbon domain-containing protein [candidate division Zixibacteria bacterium]